MDIRKVAGGCICCSAAFMFDGNESGRESGNDAGCRPRCALSGVHRTWCAVIGAAFIPLLTLGLLNRNSRAEWVGAEFRNHLVTNIVLLIILGFFAWIAWQTLVS